MASTTGIAGSRNSSHAADRFPASVAVRRLLVALGVLAVIFGAGGLLAAKYWPFSQEEVRQDLAEATDSAVTIRSYHASYFPPGCTLEGVEFHHGSGQFKLITIEKLVVEGSYAGMISRHVPRITAIGARVFIPPFGENVRFHSQHSRLVIEQLIANGSAVEFLSADAHKSPMIFDVHDATFRDVRWGSPLQYHLKMHNPNPPGELTVDGKFGAWADGHPQDTPMSGNYTFDHADLGVYGGIAGTLDSTGKFEGVFKQIKISGTTDTPDFVVTSGGHKHKLTTRFDGYVDATRGDTFLNRVDVRWERTLLLARGSIAGSPGRKGKIADLHFTSEHGRIEDILGLFVTAPRSPMSGDVSLVARAQIPPGDGSFLDRVKLDATFGIYDGSFKPETQKDVDELSAGARGQNKDDPETVLTNLKGGADLSGGVTTFSYLDFGVPGAHARLHGTYNVINYQIGLHGQMTVDTKISSTSSGFKSFLLKVMDPIFRKKKKGEIVPVHILGTYEKPQFGLDLGQNGDQNH